MTTIHDESDFSAVADSFGRRRSRFTHDIKDHNNSILLGTDLLNKYWEDLNAHLADMPPNDDAAIREEFEDIMITIPFVVAGIRKAARRIDEIATSGLQEIISPAEELSNENDWQSG